MKSLGKSTVHFKKLLEHSQQMCYIIDIKTTAHKGLTRKKTATPPFNLPKYKGGFAM